LKNAQIQTALASLGYYSGHVDSNLNSPEFREDLRRFQADYGLTPDGWYGKKSDAVLTPLFETLFKEDFLHRRLNRWTLTYYWIANESRWPSLSKVPLMTPTGELIAMVSARFFADVSLQGSGVLRDGRLVNVASKPDFVPCDPKVFEPVFQFAKRQGWIPNKAGYAGIRTDGSRATYARSFTVVPNKSKGSHGYGMVAGRSHIPFRTLATDIGAPSIARHDPTFKGKGGVVPRGSRVFILEFVGKKLPDGTIHDGWFDAVDTGGGIFGAHFDVFTGPQGLASSVTIPHRAHIWFSTPEGQSSEERIPMDYVYGL
jgi:3D (Asp-Asp-Asp) domain-containing protein/peptidoglycan hydrolase-like protein with peptidoglycan-binding domain